MIFTDNQIKFALIELDLVPPNHFLDIRPLDCLSDLPSQFKGYLNAYHFTWNIDDDEIHILDHCTPSEVSELCDMLLTLVEYLDSETLAIRNFEVPTVRMYDVLGITPNIADAEEILGSFSNLLHAIKHIIRKV